MDQSGPGAAAAAAAAEEVQFVVTPLMQRAVQRVLDADSTSGNDRATLRAYVSAAATYDAPRVAIPLSHVQLLSALYRALPPAAAGDAAATITGWVHELTAGSEVVAIAPVSKKKSPEFEAFLARMRLKAEKREYDGMTRNLRPKETVFDTLSGGAMDATPADSHVLRAPTNTGSSQDKTASLLGAKNPMREAAVGMNVIVVMITGYVVFWYAGKQFFHAEANSIKPVMCGIVGLIGAMILEVTLLIVRDQKQQLHNARKLAAAGEVRSTAAAGLDGAVTVMTGEIIRVQPAATATAVTPAATATAASAAGGATAATGEFDSIPKKRATTATATGDRDSKRAPTTAAAAFEPLSFAKPNSKKTIKAS